MQNQILFYPEPSPFIGPPFRVMAAFPHAGHQPFCAQKGKKKPLASHTMMAGTLLTMVLQLGTHTVWSGEDPR
jgi:hypothetical protein